MNPGRLMRVIPPSKGWAVLLSSVPIHPQDNLRLCKSGVLDYAKLRLLLFETNFELA